MPKQDYDNRENELLHGYLLRTGCIAELNDLTDEELINRLDEMELRNRRNSTIGTALAASGMALFGGAVMSYECADNPYITGTMAALGALASLGLYLRMMPSLEAEAEHHYCRELAEKRGLLSQDGMKRDNADCCWQGMP